MIDLLNSDEDAVFWSIYPDCFISNERIKRIALEKNMTTDRVYRALEGMEKKGFFERVKA
jgi:DNA-binding MarR family transcriptional regulator